MSFAGLSATFPSIPSPLAVRRKALIYQPICPLSVCSVVGHYQLSAPLTSIVESHNLNLPSSLQRGPLLQRVLILHGMPPPLLQSHFPRTSHPSAHLCPSPAPPQGPPPMLYHQPSTLHPNSSNPSSHPYPSPLVYGLRILASHVDQPVHLPPLGSSLTGCIIPQ